MHPGQGQYSRMERHHCIMTILEELNAPIREDHQSYIQYWSQQQGKRLNRIALPIPEQAKLEFGLVANSTPDIVESMNNTVNSDHSLKLIEAVEQTRSKLIMAHIDYNKLVLEYKATLADLQLECQKPIPEPIMKEYFMNLLNGLSLKLESMRMYNSANFGIESGKLKVIKAELIKECESKSEQLQKILSRKTEYERLARKYGDLKREVRAKKELES